MRARLTCTPAEHHPCCRHSTQGGWYNHRQSRCHSLHARSWSFSDQLLTRLLQDLSVKAASQLAADLTGIKKKIAYQRALELTDKD